MQNIQNRSTIFLYWLKGYFKLFSWSLISLTSFRLLWFFNYKKGDEFSYYLNDLLKAFILGARFDISALCYLTFPSILIWFSWFLFYKTAFKFDILKMQKRYWLFILLSYIIILAADFNYYGFFQDHFNVLIFGFIYDDTIALLRTFWKNYPLIKIFIALIITGWFLNLQLFKIWNHHSTQNIQNIKINSWLLGTLFFIFFLMTSVGARGGFGLFPLEIMHTAISNNTFINTLSFNSAHALVHAFQLHDQQSHKWNENLLRLGYGENPTQAIIDFAKLSNKRIKTLPQDQSEIYSTTRSIDSFSLKKSSSNSTLPNIVFVLMESWGSDWISEQSPNFNILGALEKHIKEDFYTPNLLPASVATIGSLGSLAVDLPHRLYSPFLSESVFLGVSFEHAPALFLQSKGYETHFVYGGNLGWRSINHFLPKQGFQFIHGEPDIRKHFSSIAEENISHDWGVHDEYVFKYAKIILEKSNKPKFIFILTTSNHPPYSLPSNYIAPPLEFTPNILNNLIGDLKLNKDRLKAFQYSNDQLGLFISNLKEDPLHLNTIFLATGDHSFYIKQYENLDFFKKWSVPLFLHIPKKHLPKSTSVKLRMGSHLDIFPTIYNLIFSNIEYFSLGHDLLDPSEKAWAFHAPSFSCFDENFGIIINSHGQIMNSLCSDSKLSFKPCELNNSHEILRKKYISLMGVADIIFEKNRRLNSQKTKNLKEDQ